MTKENVLKSTIYNITGFVVQKFFTFFYHIFIARILDKEKYGIFNFVMSIAGISPLIADMGLSETNRYFVAKTNGDKRVVSTIFYLKMITLIIVSIIISITTYFLLNQYWIYINLALIYFFLFDMIIFFINVLSSTKNFKKANIINTIFVALRVILSILFVFLTTSLFGLFFGMILSGIIILFYLVFKFRKTLKYFDRSRIKEFFNFGKYSGILNFSSLLYGLTDNIILGVFLNPIYVGFYTISQKIQGVSASVLNTIVSTTFPYFVDWINKGEISKIKKTHDYFIHYILFFSIPLSIVLFFKSQAIISILFGKQYLEAEIILKILSLIIIKAPLDYVYYNLIIAKGDIKYVSKITLMTAILNIPLDIIFVHFLGFPGVAASTLILEYIKTTFYYTYVKQNFGLKIDQYSLLKQIFSGFVFLLFVLITQPLIFPIDIIIPGIFYILYFHFFIMNIFKILEILKKKLGKSN